MAQVEVDFARQHDHSMEMLEGAFSDTGDSEKRGRKRKNPCPEKLMHVMNREEDTEHPLMYMECEDDDDDNDDEDDEDDDENDEDYEGDSHVDIRNISRDYFNNARNGIQNEPIRNPFMSSDASPHEPPKKPRKSYYKPKGTPRGRPRKNAIPPGYTPPSYPPPSYPPTSTPSSTPGGEGGVSPGMPGASPSPAKQRKSYYVPTGKPRGRPKRDPNAPPKPRPAPVAPGMGVGEGHEGWLDAESEDGTLSPSQAQSPRKSPGFVLRLKDPLDANKVRRGRPKGSDNTTCKLNALVKDLIPKNSPGRPRVRSTKPEQGEKRPRGRPRTKVRPEDEIIKNQEADLAKLKGVIAEQDQMIAMLVKLIKDNGLQIPADCQKAPSTTIEETPPKRFVMVQPDGSYTAPNLDEENAPEEPYSIPNGDHEDFALSNNMTAHEAMVADQINRLLPGAYSNSSVSSSSSRSSSTSSSRSSFDENHETVARETTTPAELPNSLAPIASISSFL